VGGVTIYVGIGFGTSIECVGENVATKSPRVTGY